MRSIGYPLSFIGEYSGDVLWALMLFLVVSFVLAGRPLFLRCIISLILAFAVEVSQLYHSPWIDGIRSTTLGGLVLGFGFLWSDLVCYLVGITAGVLADRFLWPPSSTRKYELAMTQFVFGSPVTNPAAALSADRFLCHELSDSPEWHRTELTVRKPK